MMTLAITILILIGASQDAIAEPALKHCGGSLSEDHYQELLDLTDTSDYLDFSEAPVRTARIAEIFAEAGDRRGIFSSMYVEITRESYGSTVSGVYEHQNLAEGLVYVFADKYLKAFHGHLLGDQIEPKWQAYFDLAQDCNSSPLHVLAAGVNTHLTYDLPWTLLEIGADYDFEEDFMKFGDVLVTRTEASTNLLMSQQGVDAAAFFAGFFIGKGIDTIAGELFTTRLMFQQVRSNSWTDFVRKKYSEDKDWQNSAENRWFRRHQMLKALPLLELID